MVENAKRRRNSGKGQKTPLSAKMDAPKNDAKGTPLFPERGKASQCREVMPNTTNDVINTAALRQNSTNRLAAVQRDMNTAEAEKENAHKGVFMPISVAGVQKAKGTKNTKSNGKASSQSSPNPYNAASGTFHFDYKQCELTSNNIDSKNSVFSFETSGALSRACDFCCKIMSNYKRRTCDKTIREHMDNCECDFLRENFAPGRFVEFTEDKGPFMICPHVDFRIAISPGSTLKFLIHFANCHPEHTFKCLFCQQPCSLKQFSYHNRQDAIKLFLDKGCKCKKCKETFYSVQTFYSHLKTVHNIASPNKSSFSSTVNSIGERENDLFIFALFLHKYDALI